METVYQVYVLLNPAGKYYIGLSEDIHQRLIQHNQGDSKWTAKYRPWQLVWSSDTMTLSDARKLENKLKRAKGGHGFYSVTGLKRAGS
jgi:putative endonuclease